MIVLHSAARSSCSIAALPPSTASFSSSFVSIHPSTHEISALQPPVGMHVSENALAGRGMHRGVLKGNPAIRLAPTSNTQVKILLCIFS